MSEEVSPTGPWASAIIASLKAKVDTGEIAVTTAAGAALLAALELGKLMTGNDARAKKWMRNTLRALEREKACERAHAKKAVRLHSADLDR